MKSVFTSTLMVVIILFSAFACQPKQENTNNSASVASKNEVKDESALENSEIQKPLYEDDDIIISNAYVRVAPKNGMTAGYMTIKWKSIESDSLVNFKTNAAKNHEIHETYDKGEGMMGMRQINGLKLTKGDEAKLFPGGPHLMIMQLNQMLAAGDQIDLELMFVNKASINVKLPVKSLLGN